MTWYLFPHIHLSLSMYYLNKNILLLLLFCVCASWVNSKWNVFRRTAIKNLSATTTKTTSTTITATTMGRRMRESNEERKKNIPHSHSKMCTHDKLLVPATYASCQCQFFTNRFNSHCVHSLFLWMLRIVHNTPLHSTPLDSTPCHSITYTLTHLICL